MISTPNVDPIMPLHRGSCIVCQNRKHTRTLLKRDQNKSEAGNPSMLWSLVGDQQLISRRIFHEVVRGREAISIFLYAGRING